MFLPALVLTMSLISSSYSHDFIEEFNPPHRITLSKIVAAQRMINDDYPFAPPNSPITPIIRAVDTRIDSCFRGVTKLIITIGDIAIRIMNTLNR